MSLMEKVLRRCDAFQGQSLEERMEHFGIPGVSMAAFENYDSFEARVFGSRRLKPLEPVFPDTLFQAASISKPVFAVGVMRLFQQGKVDLDADIKQYLKGYAPPSYKGKEYPITLRRLLSHTAGTGVHGFGGYRRSGAIPDVRQILMGEKPANSPKVALRWKPGERYSYSGGGTTMAQKTIMDITGMDFPTFMEKTVLKPFGMKLSTYEQPLPAERDGERATGYRKGNRRLDGDYRVMPELGAAGLWTTPSELLKLGSGLSLALCGKSDIIKKETVEEMLRPIHPEKPRMGIGFRLGEPGEADMFYHNGQNHGFISGLFVSKTGGRGVSFMMNTSACFEFVMELNNAVKSALKEEEGR